MFYKRLYIVEVTNCIKEFGEKPLDKLADGISNTAIFRSIAFIGDSLSSGELETAELDGKQAYFIKDLL